MAAKNTAPVQTPSNAPSEKEEWDDVETSRSLVSWQKAIEAQVPIAIEGWILAEDLVKEESVNPATGQVMREFICLRILLTQPTTIVNPKGEKESLKAGQTLLVPKSAALAELADLTIDPEVVRKVRIAYAGTIPLQGSKTLRQFKVQLSRSVGSRQALAPTTQAKMIAAMKERAAGALPAAGETTPAPAPTA